MSAARRPFPVTCYIDESGQLMPERPEQAAGGVWIARREFGVLVAVLRPGIEPLDDEVVSLVQTLRERYGRPSGRLKTADMPVDARLEVARLIQRGDWQVYQQAVEWSPDLDEGVAEHLIRHVREASTTMGPERAAEASVDALLDQVGRMDRTQVAWAMSLYQLLTLICADGRQGLRSQTPSTPGFAPSRPGSVWVDAAWPRLTRPALRHRADRWLRSARREVAPTARHATPVAAVGRGHALRLGPHRRVGRPSTDAG